MWSSIGKAALAASFVALTPAASILSGGQAQAHSDVYVSGSVAVGFPSLVVGFSFGDPFIVGHVHHSPVHCAVGPLYYYPDYGVYSHYYPRHRYTYYARPLARHHDVRFYHYGGHGYKGYRGYDGYRGYRAQQAPYGHGPYRVKHSSHGRRHHDDRKYNGHRDNGRHDNGRNRGGRDNGTRGHRDRD